MVPRAVAPQSDWALHVASFITIYEAFHGMEPHVDLFWWIFIGRALSEGKPPKTASIGGFAL